MKQTLCLLIGLAAFSCSQKEENASIPTSTVAFNAEDKLMVAAGLPTSRPNRQWWAEHKRYQDVDKITQTFLAQNSGKLSVNEQEIFDRASSHMILSDMGLIDSQDHPKIKQYLTTYFKSGGTDVSLLWKGLNIARKNGYWDKKMESDAVWFLNMLIDVNKKSFTRDIEKNNQIVAGKPVYKELLEGDNKRMAELSIEYINIKAELAKLPQKQPASKELYMTPAADN